MPVFLFYAFCSIFLCLNPFGKTTKNVEISQDSVTTTSPQQLIYFNATLTDSVVNLKWAINNSKSGCQFNVEKSENGSSFVGIMSTSSSTRKQHQTEYMDIDYNPLPGYSYYRLKIVDPNGHASFSNIVSIENSDEKLEHEYINIVSRSSSSVKSGTPYLPQTLVVLKSTTGKEFYSKIEVQKMDSGLLLAINHGEDLPKGTYLITGSSENELKSKKLIVR